MKINWEKVRQTNQMNVSWIEWRYIRDGMRCSRLGRRSWTVSHGTDRAAAGPRRKLVKLLFESKTERIIDVMLPDDTPATIERYLAFAIQCFCDSTAPIDPCRPIHALCGVRLEKMMCHLNAFEKTHPKYGSHFRGTRPDVSVALLANMVSEAIAAKTIRLVGPVLDFDPRD